MKRAENTQNTNKGVIAEAKVELAAAIKKHAPDADRVQKLQNSVRLIERDLEFGELTPEERVEKQEQLEKDSELLKLWTKRVAPAIAEIDKAQRSLKNAQRSAESQRQRVSALKDGERGAHIRTDIARKRENAKQLQKEADITEAALQESIDNEEAELKRLTGDLGEGVNY